MGVKSGTVRTFPLGMDRYRRYYWCLPSFKGVLVESIESSIHPTSSGDSDYNLRLAEPKPEAEAKAGVESESHTTKDVKVENGELSVEKMETLEMKSEIKCEPEINVTDISPMKSEHVKTENSKMDSKDPLFSIGNSVEDNNTDTTKSKIFIDNSESLDNTKPQQTSDNTKQTSSLTNNSSSHSQFTSSIPQQNKDQTGIRPNGVTNSHSPHSIASWLSSTIDSIFIRENAVSVSSGTEPPSATCTGRQSSAAPPPPISSQHTITTQSGDVKNIIIPSQPLPTASAYTLPSNVMDDQWFELSRYI